MVGGPTLTPFLPPLLKDALGVEARHVADPTTIVALGAALFASTQKLPAALRPGASGAAGGDVGQVSLRLEFESMTTNVRPLLVGHVEGGPAGTPLTVEIKTVDGQFDSGRVAVAENHAFSTVLTLQKDQLNAFVVEVFAADQPDPVCRSQFTILHGMSVGKPPLSQSVGVMLADNSTRWYLRKGQPLPSRKSVTHATTEALRRGQSGNAIHVPLVQGENERADRNKIIGVLRIHAEKIGRDLPAGSEVEVTLAVDEFSNTSARAYVPLLDCWFDEVVAMQMETKEKTEVERGLQSQKDRLSELEAMAHKLEGESSGHIDSRLDEVQQLIDEGDEDSVQLAEQLVRIATVEIDQAESQTKLQQLEREFNEYLPEARDIVRDHGNSQEQQAVESLVGEFHEAIVHQDEQRAEAKRDQLYELVDRILFRTPGFWNGMLGHLIKQLEDLGLVSLAESDIQDGIDAANREDMHGVMQACHKLYDRLPRDEKEKVPMAPAMATITSNIT